MRFPTLKDKLQGLCPLYIRCMRCGDWMARLYRAMLPSGELVWVYECMFCHYQICR